MAESGQKKINGNSSVAVRNLKKISWDNAVSEIFECFPTVKEKIKRCKNIFIKVNAVYFHPYLYTSPHLITAVVNYAFSFDSRKKIYLMDNCSQGNFTRLCFNATGLDKLAKRIGARSLFLDEEKAIPIKLKPEMSDKYSFPRILNMNLIENPKNSCYINMPVLKSHCQAQMTCGLKNQMGLIYAHDRAKRHNHQLHQSIVDILSYIQPDFTIVDAEKVLESGPMPAGRYVKELLHDRDLVFGGTDTVAVDTVAATILGYDPEEVEHVKLAAEQGYGSAELNQIEIDGTLPLFSDRVSWHFQTHFPGSLRFIKGQDGVCMEGCLGHAEQVLELVINDGASPEVLENRPLTIVTGRNFTDDQLTDLVEPIIVLGHCACHDALPRIQSRYQKVDVLNTCGRCDNILNLAVKRLEISAVNIAPVAAPKLLGLWLIGKANGLKYNLPL